MASSLDGTKLILAVHKKSTLVILFAMWNSTSRVSEGGTKYEYPELDAIINFIGCAIEGEEDSNDQPLAKDNECDFHHTAYLNGITNGEYIYVVFEILTEMMDDEPYKTAPFYKEAVLASLIDGITEEFLDLLQSEEFPIKHAQDIWNLHVAYCQKRKVPLWADDDGKEVRPPVLTAISKDDWEWILEEIQNEFLWDRDWELGLFGGSNFALVKEQPHFPSLQEYRTAKTWIMDAYSKTSWNKKSSNKTA
jgi:hypothetical protein